MLVASKAKLHAPISSSWNIVIPPTIKSLVDSMLLLNSALLLSAYSMDTTEFAIVEATAVIC